MPSPRRPHGGIRPWSHRPPLRRTPEDVSVSGAPYHIRELRATLRRRMIVSDDTLSIIRLATKPEVELFDFMQEPSDSPCPDPNLHKFQPQST